MPELVEATTRHNFKASPNPRTTSCVQCGRSEKDSLHEYSELAHRAAVAAHFQRASKLIGEGEWALAEAEGKTALRILKEDVG